jgi:polyisoprenoid-binding protein YceI
MMMMMTIETFLMKSGSHQLKLQVSGAYHTLSVLVVLAILIAWSRGYPDEIALEDVVYYTGSGHAEFTSSVPLHSFTGKSDHLTGMIDLRDNVIDFYLDLNTLKTGIGRRDRDMYRTLNVSDHPYAEFTGSLETGFDSESGDAQKVTATGVFTMSGVARDVRIDGQLTKTGSGLLLEAEWIINIRDHDIEPPGILFYRVDEEMEVRIRAVLDATGRETIPAEG